MGVGFKLLPIFPLNPRVRGGGPRRPLLLQLDRPYDLPPDAEALALVVASLHYPPAGEGERLELPLTTGVPLVDVLLGGPGPRLGVYQPPPSWDGPDFRGEG